MASAQGGGLAWLGFVLLTVASWGVYGVFLHNGQTAMADPENGRYKAFLFVGVAYFLTAVLAPLLLLVVRQAGWGMPVRGVAWSLVAGLVGAVGAFGVLLAFGAGGTPSAVMSLVFAGAPVVNAVVALTWHPPAGGLAAIRWPFFAGIALAALGGYLVTVYKPAPTPPAPPAATAAAPAADGP
ncbi:MAG: hypothetical protein OES32_06155 [Acidobacteriota bacterium]|nr:hypothetical protein [Acidobacteriota bacterium]MDH3523152.1 hypothetical protein [Acidobacteriota bacterium]